MREYAPQNFYTKYKCENIYLNFLIQHINAGICTSDIYRIINAEICTLKFSY